MDRDKVTNQLILYCGVMFGATGASQSVRLLSSAMAKQAMKKLPQQALTKTFYYPVIKSIARFFGVSMTKSTFAKGVSKAIPIVGGIVSGGITLATLAPMGLRLADTMEQAHFGYDEEAFQADWQQVLQVIDQEEKADDSAMDEIRKAKQMLDEGILTEEEFAQVKVGILKTLGTKRRVIGKY